MSIAGSLVDIAVVDLLQFVHMSQRSGTLLLVSGNRQAHISFHRGRIASAWCPTSLSVVKYLVEQRVLRAEDVARVEKARAQAAPMSSLGQALLAEKLVTWTELRDAVAAKIERTVFELISWKYGTFQLVADEVRVDDEITFAPGDVLPDIDIDTQGILLEAVRLFDERNRTGPPRVADDDDQIVVDTVEVDVSEPTPSRAAGARIQLLSDDPGLGKLLSASLSRVSVSSVDARDAGAPVPGEAQPLVVVDRRGEQRGKPTLRRIRELHPRALVVALVGGADQIAAAFNDGAIAVAEPPYLAACCANLLRSRGMMPESDSNLRSGLGRLRRVLGDLRSGLLSATVSLNLMTIVADSVERAVLFVQQKDQLVALGAFGTTHDGRSLAVITRGSSLRVESASRLARCVVEGHALTLDYDDGELPGEFKQIVDRPRSGQGVFFPVLGARRSIGLIYADNGRRASGVQDVELMELATAQVGLAFENELLRRQLERLGAEQRA